MKYTLIDLKHKLLEIFIDNPSELSPSQINYAMENLLNEKEHVYNETFVTKRTLASIFDPIEFEQMINSVKLSVEEFPIMTEVMRWLEPSEQGIDVAHESSINLINSLVENEYLTQNQGEKIKNLAKSEIPKWAGLKIKDIKKAWRLTDV